MKAKFRLIGDVHKDFSTYRYLCSEAEYSLQVGDMCTFDGFSPLKPLDAERHKCIAGNHDICDETEPYCFRNDPHFLDDYGIWTIPGLGDVFYIRGAFSIDGVRVNEELPDWQQEAALALYKATKPVLVVSHQCPSFLSAFVGNKSLLRAFGFMGEPITATGTTMRRMFEEHEPSLWVFGHYHQRWQGYVGSTRFVCLDRVGHTEIENSYLDLDTSDFGGLQR